PCRYRGLTTDSHPAPLRCRRGARPVGIATGPDGALWFTESSSVSTKIGRITTAGVFTEFPAPTNNPFDITAGPDEAMWFTVQNGNKIGRLDLLAFLVPGVPGEPNCVGKSMSFLAKHGGIAAAAADLKFASVADLANAVKDFCRM